MHELGSEAEMADGGLFLVFGSSKGGKRAVALWLGLREEEEGFVLLEGSRGGAE